MEFVQSNPFIWILCKWRKESTFSFSLVWNGWKKCSKIFFVFFKTMQSLVQAFVKFSGELRIRVKYFCFHFFCPIEIVSRKVVTVRYLRHSLIARYWKWLFSNENILQKLEKFSKIIWKFQTFKKVSVQTRCHRLPVC